MSFGGRIRRAISNLNPCKALAIKSKAKSSSPQDSSRFDEMTWNLFQYLRCDMPGPHRIWSSRVQRVYQQTEADRFNKPGRRNCYMIIFEERYSEGLGRLRRSVPIYHWTFDDELLALVRSVFEEPQPQPAVKLHSGNDIEDTLQFLTQPQLQLQLQLQQKPETLPLSSPRIKSFWAHLRSGILKLSTRKVAH